ncbi:NAD(P)H-hydrate epimerase [Thermaerobacter sp. PB12/4term]|uniref:NAD(P)H-hydrate epimerase n=1 Tax=Thermaerobacter sp. PB12/4term TaxID=2293838 RepID=UPI001FAC7884|nr:NAD(P)H-hydrate epimerase [Thermaerobacter sp. PB12/4term]
MRGETAPIDPAPGLWVLSAAAVRHGDRLAAAQGLEGLVMMETAGRTAAALLWKLAGPFSPRQPVVVLAGGGNNGGDGMVLARWIGRWAGPAATEVFLLASPGRLRGEAAVQWSLLARSGIPATALEDEPAGGDQSDPAGAGPGPDTFLQRLTRAAARARVVVDALLGVGARGSLRPLAARALEAVSGAGVPVFALDLPSGLDADTGEAGSAVPRARWTATFAAAKWGLLLGDGPERAGQVFVVDIGWPRVPPGEGIPSGEDGAGSTPTSEAGPVSGPASRAGAGFPAARVLDAAQVAALLPRRPWAAHKGWAGHVVVVGGRPGQVGAAVLAGMGALQAGAGTVTLALPAPLRPEAAAHLPEVMTWGLPATPEGEWDAQAAAALTVREGERRGRVVRVVGPGLGQSPGAAACLATWIGVGGASSVPAPGNPGIPGDPRGRGEPVPRGPAGDRDAPATSPTSSTSGYRGGPVARRDPADPGDQAAATGAFPPTVLDADGLNLAAALGLDRLRQRPGAFPLVLTPHPGEAARLLGWTTAQVQARRPLAALELARRAGAVAVLKGAGTLVASPDGQLFICTRGHPGMASAGMGDTLAGITGAMLAQGLEPLAAALAAVYLHALAGELAADRAGVPVRATRLIDRLPAALDLTCLGLPETADALGVPGAMWLRAPLSARGVASTGVEPGP